MKKVLAVLFALLLVLSMAGCSESTTEDGGGDTTAQDVADGITSITAPAQDATTLTLPTEAGYTITIATSDDTGVIALDGTITPPSSQTTVNLTLLVVNNADGADTGTTVSIAVVVPAASVPPEQITVWVTTPAWSGTGTALTLFFSGNGGDGWTTPYVMAASFSWNSDYSVTIDVTDATAATSYCVQFTQDASTKTLVYDETDSGNNQPDNWVSLSTTTDIIYIDLGGSMLWDGDNFSLDPADFGTAAP